MLIDAWFKVILNESPKWVAQVIHVVNFKKEKNKYGSKF